MGFYNQLVPPINLSISVCGANIIFERGVYIYVFIFLCLFFLPTIKINQIYINTKNIKIYK